MRNFTWDANSNVTQVRNGWRDTTYGWHSDTESYSYDGLDRLTSASCTLWSHTYAYDKVGNRTSKDSVTSAVNTVNEVTSLSDGTTFTYDANGNRTQKTKDTDTWVYTYDYANRLTKVEENSSILGEYIYDGDGKRIQITDDSNPTTYIYSGLEVLYEETMNSAATYIYGPTGRLTKKTTINGETNTFFYHTDRLKSTRLVTDERKTIVSAVTYHPFGESSTEHGLQNHLYTGKEKDSTDLYYYGARYYDAEIGRFITRDQKCGRISNPQTLNRYTYCINNPIRYIDPDGQDYFDPDWAKEWYVEDTPGCNPESLSTGFALGTHKLIVSSMSNLGAEIRENRLKHGVIGVFIVMCWEIMLYCVKYGGLKGIAAGALGALCLLLFSETSEFYNDLWENDPSYKRLVSTAEYYQNLFEIGVDCEEELDIAMIDLYVYMLRAKHGEHWKSYAPAWLMRAYLWLSEKRENEQANTNGNNEIASCGSESYTSPPDMILI